MMNKETINEFLKPDWRKILIVLIFMGLSYFFKVDCLQPGMLGACEVYGFPMPYLGMESGDFVYVPQYSILWLGLIIDFVFWYLISSAIIFTYDKFKTKK